MSMSMLGLGAAQTFVCWNTTHSRCRQAPTHSVLYLLLYFKNLCSYDAMSFFIPAHIETLARHVRFMSCESSSIPYIFLLSFIGSFLPPQWAGRAHCLQRINLRFIINPYPRGAVNGTVTRSTSPCIDAAVRYGVERLILLTEGIYIPNRITLNIYRTTKGRATFLFFSPLLTSRD